MVERHRVVPDRVPEPVGHLHHVRPAIVDEQQVEVAPGGEVASPEAPDRQERQALGGIPHRLRRAAASQGSAAAPPAGRDQHPLPRRVTAQSKSWTSQLSVSSPAALLQSRPRSDVSSRRRAHPSLNLGSWLGRVTWAEFAISRTVAGPEPGCQPRGARRSGGSRSPDRLLRAHQHDTSLGACHRRVKKLPCEDPRRRRGQQHYDLVELRTLRSVRGHGEGGLDRRQP